MKVIHSTRSYCCDCHCYHDALYYIDSGCVFFKMLCDTPRTTLISRHPDIYMHLWNKSYFTTKNVQTIPVSNRIEITNACNFTCNLCYAGASPNKNSFISLEKIARISEYLRREKRTDIGLTGGEPTLHPELLKIVSIFKKAGHIISLYSNGYLIAKEPTLAGKLKEQGVYKCFLQFDTLNPQTHQLLRNNSFVKEKLQALQNLTKAKIKVSPICVMVKENAHEVKELLDQVRAMGPYFGELIFLTAIQDTGRFTLEKGSPLLRDDIIVSIIKHSGIPGIGIEHFWPFPKFLPLEVNLHPDCATIVYLLIRNGSIELLDSYINIKRLYSLCSKMKKNTSYRVAYLKVLFLLLPCIKWTKCITVAKIIYSYITKKGGCFINYIVVESFMTRYCQDAERLHSCTSHHVLDENISVSACVFNQDGDIGSQCNRFKNPQI
ncbi:MAG TPA: radical SAM protein [Treponemataceae bacterium]|nr:radical SAM protein [Treponemataceae bacterium]